MEGKNERPKPRKVNDVKEDVPTQHEEKSVIFKSELRHDSIDFYISPTISGKYPNYFLITSLKGIAYSCTIRSSLG